MRLLRRRGTQARSAGVIATCLVALVSFAVEAAAAPRSVPGLRGAVKVPFDMPLDGEATLALYNARGGVVRILGQCIRLDRGPWEAGWDGMDLFGNLVPAGTELTLKVITNRPLKAVYEFTVANAGDPPWLTRPTGEGAEMRTGGWMGDHTPPYSAMAFGDRIFFGCQVAEHGHAFIATDLEGHKLWGRGGLEGWKGPYLLAHDGKAVFGVANKTKIHRLDPATYKTKRLGETGKDEAHALAAKDNTLYLVVENHLAVRDLSVKALTGKDVNCPQSRPQTAKAGSVPEQHLDAFARFSTVFTGSQGHPQTGFRAVDAGGFAYFIVRFARPVTVGTVVLERIEGAAAAEVHVLRAGAKYDLLKLTPSGGIDDILGRGKSDWVSIGKTTFAAPLSFITAPRAGLSTEALYVRLTPSREASSGKWTPTVGMCRILKHRLTRVDGGAAAVVAKELLAADGVPKPAGAAAAAGAWRVESPRPISVVNQVPVLVQMTRPRTIDAICLLNCTGPIFLADAYVGPAGATPDVASDAHWKELGEFTARSHKRGWDSAKINHNERTHTLPEPVTTRALRLRFTSGRKAGKWGVPADVHRIECDDVALLAEAEPGEAPPKRILQVRDGETGELRRQIAHPSAAIDAMAFGPDGVLYCVIGDKLCRSEIGEGEVRHTVLNDKELKRAVSLAVSDKRIAVGDDERCAVLVFDKAGKLELVIGDKGPRKRGPWDPQTIQSPTGVAIAADGSIWVAECQYSPKRIARFSADGKCEKQFFGPAEYGGGGFLDPDLKSFYYRSAQYELDWAKGTWRLKALNDRLYTPETPSLDGSTFKYTKIGRPIYVDGRRYIVGDPGWQGSPGPVICLLEGDVWKPCAVMGNAQGARLLTEKAHWRKHWLEQDLSDKAFIWCDLNGDGGYQVDEVELFKIDTDRFGTRGPFDVPYWGSWIGPKLTFWGRRARLAPARFTDKGVPVYRSADLEPFDYGKLAPQVTNTMICGMRAKPGPESTSIITHDGSLLIEGQPFKVLPNRTLKGGPPPEKTKGQYVPPIAGHVLDNPLHWVGTAETTSPIGEIAVMLGNSGRWYAWSAEHGVIVGRFFTGEQGGWGTGLQARRGMDVTGLRLGYECFFGHFIKAHDGNYYTVGGHGFHALCRIDGLDDYRISEVPVKVTAAALASNRKLQPILARLHAAAEAQRKSKVRKELQVKPLARRTSGFKLDGSLLDWGVPRGMQAIDEAQQLYVDAACDDDGLYLAYTGVGHTANDARDFRHLFKTGFCFDFRYRSRPDGSRDVVAGDRRIVFGRCDGEWIAVLYDYVDESVPPARHVEFSSPWVTTTVARVVKLSPAEATVKFHRVKELDLLAGLPKGKEKWSAEVFLKWPALGMARPDPKSKANTLTCDFGILTGDAGGTGVEKRCYWSNRAALTVSDLGIEAQLQPGAWGRAKFVAK